MSEISQPESSQEAPVSEIKASDSTDLAQRVAVLEQKLESVLEILSDEYRFGQLRRLLMDEKWKEADLETTKVMVELTGRTKFEDITPEDLQSFPCNALQVIDNLWLKYSHNHFGFSHQLRLYIENGGSLDAIRAQEIKYLHKVADQIGWRIDGQPVEYDDYHFSLESPLGGLPGNWWNSPYGAKMANFFLARLMSCEL